MGFILGVDEVGRGCWAGPLVAGAVILDQPIIGLRDSKKLSPKARAVFAKQIHSEARAAALGWVSPKEIDTIGLTAAVRLAMLRAINQVTLDYDELIIDGSYNFFPHDPRSRAIVKADDLVQSVSAASIIAKVARDTYMWQLSELLPDYAFEKHVGYGTPEHIAKLSQYGPTVHHRMSYKPLQRLIQS